MSVVLETADLDQGGRAGRPGRALLRSPRSRLLLQALPGVIALIVWRLSLLHVDVADLGSYGLPPALPIAWYVALVIAVGGTVAAITTRDTAGWIMVGYVLAVAVILYATVPVLSAQPHYAWVYKHIGVVRYLEAHGKVNPSIDIYNRWPGFFALAAAFSTIAGRGNPETYAGWAELVFLVLDCLLVMAAVKVITRELRIATAATLFFVVTNWVGQTYYSPQAFAFLLSMAMIVVTLRHLRVDRSAYSKRLTRLIEGVGRVRQASVRMEEPARWPRWAAITAVLTLDALVVVSHQLTPYMLLISMALLLLTGVVRPWWVLVAMVIMTFAYLAANFSFIQRNYGLFTSIDPFNNAQVSEFPQTPSAGKVFNIHAELLAIATLWLGTVWAMVRLLRCGLLMRALPFVVLALAPFGVIFGQNYGGEASLRIILFSSPWCSALISWALATVTRTRLKWALTMVAALGFTACFIPSYLGLEELNIISASEVRASEWFYNHGRPGSVLVLSAPGFPYKYGATYPEFKGPEGDAHPNLVSSPVFQDRRLGAADIPYVLAKIREYSKHGYLAFTKNQTTYAEVLGITPPGALGQLEIAVARSPDFRLWYINKHVRIYEMLVAQPGGGTPTEVGVRRPRGRALPSRRAARGFGPSARPARVRESHGAKPRQAERGRLPRGSTQRRG